MCLWSGELEHNGNNFKYGKEYLTIFVYRKLIKDTVGAL